MTSENVKGLLRKQKKTERDALPLNERKKYSHEICEALGKLTLLTEAKAVYCCAPIGSEVDLWELTEQLWAMGKQVAFPRVCKDQTDTMEFFEVSSRRELVEGTFHVPEPLSDGRKPVDWKGALVLVPGVVFDPSGRRCGYGKGYYDKYFAAHPELVRIGISYETQLSENLAACWEETDVPLDYVLTEKALYCRADQMSYEELVDQIGCCRRFGRAPGVECSRAVMERFQMPQETMRFVHIAGTNGKGSVAAFLREICERSGIRAGVFTSPHLEEFTERIRIGHQQIPRECVERLCRLVMKENHQLMVSKGMNLTMFDYCLAIGLLYFKEQQTDLVILETGMGGTLDSTNIIPAPLVSVITGIGLEHTEYLGDTIAAIAGEKAGILKPGSHAVLMDQDREGLDVLIKTCEEKQIPYVVSGQLDAAGVYKNARYEMGMLGAYQRKNAAAAIEAANLLADNGFSEITGETIGAGIRHARWEGRMELVSERPWVLLDGAHNVHGVTALVQSLKELSGNNFYTFFMGVMADKDYETMLDLILPLAKQIYTLAPDSGRALSADKLCAIIQRKGGSAAVCADTDAFLKCLHAQDSGERCVVFGSLYLIGEIRKQLERGML